MTDESQFNMHDAKSNLSKLVERVESGEEITIARNGRPVAKLVPIQKPNRIGELIGKWEGQVQISEDFDEPIPEIMVAFYGPNWRDEFPDG